MFSSSDILSLLGVPAVGATLCWWVRDMACSLHWALKGPGYWVASKASEASSSLSLEINGGLASAYVVSLVLYCSASLISLLGQSMHLPRLPLCLSPGRWGHLLSP